MPTTPTDIQIPTSLPVLPGIVLTGRYLMTEAEPINRGDSLDAYALPGGRLALMVADVVGYGFQASIAATQLRTVLRDRLANGATLRSAVQSLHGFAERTPDAMAATLCAAVVDVASGITEYVTAGHPPPVTWSRTGGPRFLTESRCQPLGTGGEVRTAVAQLGADEAIALYTDGMTVGSGLRPDRDDARLRRAISNALVRHVEKWDTPVAHGEAICEHLLTRGVPQSGCIDDVALLLARRVDVPEPLRLECPAVPSSVPTARSELARWLEDLGAGLIDQVGLGHAVGELARNVVDHAYVDTAPGTLTLTALLDDTGRAVVRVGDQGRWRETDSEGHGLMMAAGLADSIHIRRDDRGTEVELRQELTRPVQILQSVPEADDRLQLADEELRVEAGPGQLAVEGIVDDLNIEVFQAALRDTTRAGTADAVVDLSRLTVLASPGVQALFEVQRRCERSGAKLRLVAAPETAVSRVLRLVGLLSDL